MSLTDPLSTTVDDDQDTPAPVTASHMDLLLEYFYGEELHKALKKVEIYAQDISPIVRRAEEVRQTGDHDLAKVDARFIINFIRQTLEEEAELSSSSSSSDDDDDDEDDDEEDDEDDGEDDEEVKGSEEEWEEEPSREEEEQGIWSLNIAWPAVGPREGEMIEEVGPGPGSVLVPPLPPPPPPGEHPAEARPSAEGFSEEDEAWRRPMPHSERRRAGKHTRRVIVK